MLLMFPSLSVHCFFMPFLLKNEERIQGEVRQTCCDTLSLFICIIFKSFPAEAGSSIRLSCEVCQYKCSPRELITSFILLPSIYITCCFFFLLSHYQNLPHVKKNYKNCCHVCFLLSICIHFLFFCWFCCHLMASLQFAAPVPIGLFTLLFCKHAVLYLFVHSKSAS